MHSGEIPSNWLLGSAMRAFHDPGRVDDEDFDGSGSCGHHPAPEMSREMVSEIVRVPSSGLNLNVETFGEGSTNVLFVHGLGANRDCWREARQFFPASRFRLLFPDFPGVGDSDRPSDFDYSMAAFGRCLRDVVTSLGASAFHVVAHSMGGVAVLEACKLDGFVPVSFLSAEGNLEAEDAFMSSKMARLSESVFLKTYSKWVNLVEATLDVAFNTQHARFVASLRAASPVAVYRSAVSCQTLTRSRAPRRAIHRIAMSIGVRLWQPHASTAPPSSCARHRARVSSRC
ncbi:MAG: alpha/beta hydrolase family protein [Polyangiaceae bacterium]